jgi:erythronate-4-phosphate dehydrogenase
MINHAITLLADASLPELDHWLPSPFILTRYQHPSDLSEHLKNHDILLCRSTLRVDASLLAHSSITCVATASSGIDHIDSSYLTHHDITLFDAKGSNAPAVADYVMATLAALKKIGRPIGNRAGVIGVGEVGSRVVRRLHAMGFDVVCYDPLKTAHDTHHTYVSLSQLTECDLLCLHPNLHDSQPFPSRQLLNAHFINKLKPNVTIINASRGGVVDEEALLQAHQPITYCTDVYENEPNIDARVVNIATFCTPHIAGHTIEAKQAAIIQISQHLHQHYDLAMPATVQAHTHSNKTHKQSYVQNTALDLFVSKLSWEEDVLNLYNPLIETNQLKTAQNKKTAFITLRQDHRHRHDFFQEE